MAMSYRIFLRSFAALAFLGLALGLTSSAQSSRRGRKYKSPPPTARLDVLVLRDDDGKPLENASVIFHPMKDGKDEGGMELKSNEDGKTMIDVLPLGYDVLLQVIAKGYQTYGQEYKIDKPQMSFEIRLKRPGGQYSIYKPHSNSDSGKSSDSNKDKKDSDKPGDGKQPDNQNSQPPSK